MRKLFVPAALLASLVAVVFLVVPGIGAADPNLKDVPVHQHWLVKGTGADMIYLATVGPDFCHNDHLQNAFNQFHNNVHRADQDPNSIGPAAPGLHNFQGGEIVSRGCNFVPPPS